MGNMAMAFLILCRIGFRLMPVNMGGLGIDLANRNHVSLQGHKTDDEYQN